MITRPEFFYFIEFLIFEGCKYLFVYNVLR